MSGVWLLLQQHSAENLRDFSVLRQSMKAAVSLSKRSLRCLHCLHYLPCHVDARAASVSVAVVIAIAALRRGGVAGVDHRDQDEQTQSMQQRRDGLRNRRHTCQHIIPQPLHNKQLQNHKQNDSERRRNDRATGGSTSLKRILLRRGGDLLI